ncbi:MAG: hypothetical protein U1F83_17525 [Verrucomicrobiota bacterium]
MVITPASGALSKFRRTPWRFQRTLELGDVEQFVSLILESHGDISGGTVTIEEVVFDTVHLASVCPAQTKFVRDCSIAVQSREDVRLLLIAALGDGPDFLFIPSPKPFVLYADHHYLVTFYANTKSHLNHVVEPLVSHGHRFIENFQREL